MRRLTVAVLGGDRREAEMARILAERGITVRVVGLPSLESTGGVFLAGGIAEAVEGADAVIAPVLGVDEQGYLHTMPGQPRLRFTEEEAKLIGPGIPLMIGAAPSWLREVCESGGANLVEFRELDDYAILNSIPSAEGAIQMAMERLDITLHASQAFVLGFGRTGQTLARMLNGLGAITSVAARKRADLARIYELGYRPIEFRKLTQYMPEADVVFNTVPAMVLDRDVLRVAREGLVVIDLASAPGGTDFEEARRLGIDAVLAPGLPGKVAPRTAGKILAELMLRLVEEMLPE